jgi:hypothetical protein
MPAFMGTLRLAGAVLDGLCVVNVWLGRGLALPWPGCAAVLPGCAVVPPRWCRGASALGGYLMLCSFLSSSSSSSSICWLCFPLREVGHAMLLLCYASCFYSCARVWPAAVLLVAALLYMPCPNAMLLVVVCYVSMNCYCCSYCATVYAIGCSIAYLMGSGCGCG